MYYLYKLPLKDIAISPTQPIERGSSKIKQKP